MPREHPTELEQKWQRRWATDHIFEVDLDQADNRFYFLTMFPYPSGNLHIGHWFQYAVSDIYARYIRRKGKTVLNPIGFDSFGLPAENAAIKHGLAPNDWTEQNISKMTEQFHSAGISYDWSKVIVASRPDYYRWTQWMFLLMYKKGLAERREAPVNWCPQDQTILANEQVVGGKCERCGTEVILKRIPQWVFKITDYAEALLTEVDHLDWPEKTKTMQKNWIGRSEGAYVEFDLMEPKRETFGSADVSSTFLKGEAAGQRPASEGENSSNASEFAPPSRLKVFTTRPDTLFGVSYLVLAPEHPLVETVTSDEQHSAVATYLGQASKKSELERTELQKDKTGVFSGSYAIHPLTGDKIPVWIADYVLSTVGTGAVMGVPAHDKRDFTFAQHYRLPIKPVITRTDLPIRSYLMGGSAITDADLTDLHVIIKETKDSGSRLLEIPVSSLADYEQLIGTKLDNGYWNEYIGQTIVFIFKHPDGRTQRLELKPETVEHINQLARQFTEPDPVRGTVWDWLAENDWYRDALIHTEAGLLSNSAEFDGQASADAGQNIVARLTELNHGQPAITYRLRDWTVSRQRYWGAPIPIIYCQTCGTVPVPETDLPVYLPEDVDFRPTGQSPLARSDSFVNVSCPVCGQPAERETDTLDTFVDSSWYYCRYLDPNNDQAFAEPARLDKWLPVDLYIGGAEHTVLHLLYARFFGHVLHEAGLIPVKEPFPRLRHQGIILGPDGQKMSKSRGNVVDPDELVAKHGADVVRGYLAFLGPYNQGGPWNPGGILGIERFFDRTTRLLTDHPATDHSPERQTHHHQTIKRVSQAIEQFHFNVGLAALMEWLNWLERYGATNEDRLIFVQLLNPYAPHLSEELWAELGQEPYLALHDWPTFNPTLAEPKTVTVAVQINGKVRATFDASAGTPQSELETTARGLPTLTKYLDGKTIQKAIIIPDKLVSFVVI